MSEEWVARLGTGQSLLGSTVICTQTGSGRWVEGALHPALSPTARLGSHNERGPVVTRLVVAGLWIVSGLMAALQGLRGSSAIEQAQTENLAHRERRQVLRAQVFELGDRLLDEFEQSRQLASGAVGALPGRENQCLDLPKSQIPRGVSC